MHPSSLLSYYPTYNILDEIRSYGDFKNLNVFIDLKNNLQTTYMEHAIVNIVENSKQTRFLDTSIFSSIISFLVFHKIYGMKRGIDLNFYIFFESGESYYHKNISKQYKISRKVDNLYGLDRADRDLFYKVLQANFQLIENAGNKIPNVKVIRLPNLEADFVPYYILTRNKINQQSNVGNIIYSNDHDMFQTVSENTFIFSKSAKTKKIVKKGNIMVEFLKRKNKIQDEYLPLAMSILGDPGDDVRGINGIGPSRFLEIFDQLVAITGDMNSIYSKIGNKQNLVSSAPSTIQNKYLKKIVDAENNNRTITDNLKLVSFELISRAIDNPDKTEMLDKRRIIERVLESNIIYPVGSMKKALSDIGVLLEDISIDLLYHI